MIKFLPTIRSFQLFLLFVLLSGQAVAQPSAENQQPNTLQIYTQPNKVAIFTAPSDVAFDRVQTQDMWTLVRFSEPVIPVWASLDYLSQGQRRATIVGDRLNLRMGASLESQVLGYGSRGFQSKVLATENGFAKILAPTSLVFAVRTDDINRLTSSASGPQVVSPSLAAKADAEQSSVNKNIVLIEGVENQTTAKTLVTSELSSVTAEQHNQTVESPSPAPTSSELGAPEAPRNLLHRLSPGDTISLRVFGEGDLSINNVRIPQSGTVSFPLIGAYNVAGKSVEELENQLRQVLAQGYVRNPRLSISIDNYRPVFVLGAAQTIGSFVYTEGLTIAKAIALAGGAKNSAKQNGVSVLRDGQVIDEGLPVDSTNTVRSGDIISIEEELGVDAEDGSFVYLHGEVRSPGEYKFRRGLTVEKAVVLAGGFTLRASRKRVSVSRFVEGEEAPAKLRKVALHMPIEPGDIIDVGASWF